MIHLQRLFVGIALLLFIFSIPIALILFAKLIGTKLFVGGLLSITFIIFCYFLGAVHEYETGHFDDVSKEN